MGFGVISSIPHPTPQRPLGPLVKKIRELPNQKKFPQIGTGLGFRPPKPKQPVLDLFMENGAWVTQGPNPH